MAADAVPPGSFPPPSSRGPGAYGDAPGGPSGDDDDVSGHVTDRPVEPRFRPGVNLIFFLVTIVTVFAAGAPAELAGPGWKRLLAGWTFAVPLLVILVAHESGHYIAARLHKVPASLPYFIPLPPPLGPTGTLGAIIVFPDRIRSRNALLDIGAAGPLAGMLLAIPILAVGLMLSQVGPPGPGFSLQEGQSLLYWVLKRVVLDPIAAGSDVLLHPMAFAGWVGFLLTFLNLTPYGQLDGGHVAYALLGKRHDALGPLLVLMPAVLAVYNAVLYVSIAHGPANPWMVSASGGLSLLRGDLSPALNWTLLLVMLLVLRRVSGRQHPPFDGGELTLGRKLVGAFTLLLFVLLFLPTPLRIVH